MKSAFFLKSRLIFKIFYGFCMFVNKHFISANVYISKSKRCYNAKPLAYYFYMRTKISLNFHFCISVPLRAGVDKNRDKTNMRRSKSILIGF